VRRTVFFVCVAALALSGFALARGVQPSSSGERALSTGLMQRLLRQSTPMHAFTNGGLGPAGAAHTVPERLVRQLLHGTAPRRVFTSRPLAGAGSASNSQQFVDSSGDSGSGPDISTVNVSNDDSGKLTIQVRFANRQVLGAQDGVLIGLNTDLNLTTGSGGVDYVLEAIGNQWALGAWNGSSFVNAPAPTFSATEGGGLVTFVGNRSDLGNTSAFTLQLVTTADGGATTSDRAPDSGIWFFQVVIASGPSQQFVDPSGDSGSGPDFTTVIVSSDSSGNVKFQITLANRPTLAAQDLIVIPLDTDLNGATGSGGADYLLGANQAGWGLFKWDGSTFAAAPASTFSATFGAGVLTFSGNRSDLGNTNGFNFLLQSSGDNGTTLGDSAPDTGIWTFQLNGGGTGSTTTSTTTTSTTTTSAPPPPPLSLGVAKLMVGTPKAGGKWTVAMIVFRKDTGDLLTSGKVLCSAKAGGSSLQFLGKVGPASGLVACQWKVPKTAKGKRASGSMKVVFQGKSASRTFTKRIS
jgi:hypothetical protein